jgi:small-conductance mechanosensitive channel
MGLIWAAVPVDKIDDWLLPGARALIYLAGAGVLTFALSKMFARIGRLSADIIRERGGTPDAEVEKQRNTMADISRRVLFSLIWLLAVVLALREFGLEVGPILAGAGVAGLAIGFAAQSVLKDWINGFFLLAEGRIRMSDVVKIGEISGAVEQLSLRTTVLRGYDGHVHVFSNGSIQNFTNLTLGHSYATFDVAVDFDEDPERMMEIFRHVGADLRADEVLAGRVLADIEVAGVDKFTEQGVVIKARIRTQAGEQWAVGREFNRRLRAMCAERGVQIATAQRQVQVAERGVRHDPDQKQRPQRA